MAMVVMKVLQGMTGTRPPESRTGFHLLAFSGPPPPLLPNSCRTRLTRKTEFGGQNDFSRSLMRRGLCDMATGCHISLPLQKGSSTLHILRTLLLRKEDGTGWRVCGK